LPAKRTKALSVPIRVLFPPAMMARAVKFSIFVAHAK
jgi:hypothetical protein